MKTSKYIATFPVGIADAHPDSAILPDYFRQILSKIK
jgi:hypothetical protein